jgi:hypothetical protein
MPLLIDGYNLMYAAGILGSGLGPGTLERRRLALLNFLAEALEPEELPQTTVVFDARDAPWGLKQSVRHRGILVRFATKYASADALIEELIRAASAPRRLVVVSADHEIQRAARRRRAKAVDSEAWYAALVRRRQERNEAVPEPPDQPPVPLLQEDVNYWLRQFGGESLLGQSAENGPGDGLDDENPFPPDYGKDLEEA